MSGIRDLFGEPTALERLAEELVREDDDLLARLIGIRKDAKLTQEEVGKRLGVSQSAVQQFERVGGDPRLSTIRKYALAVRAIIRHDVKAFDLSWATQGRATTYRAEPSSVSDKYGHIDWVFKTAPITELSFKVVHASDRPERVGGRG